MDLSVLHQIKIVCIAAGIICATLAVVIMTMLMIYLFFKDFINKK